MFNLALITNFTNTISVTWFTTDGKGLISNRLQQRFSNCGPRTTSGPRILPLWSF